MPGRQLILAEDFSGNALDERVWNIEKTTREHRIYGNELQAYVADGTTVYIDHSPDTGANNGALALHAFARSHTVEGYATEEGKPKDKAFDFVSGRINTEGKLHVRYGSMTARMKLPALPGTFPAFWTLGLDGARWPANGEIDVMENVGEPGWTSSGIHFAPKKVGEKQEPDGWPRFDPATQRSPGQTRFRGFDASAWHEYRVDWSPGGLAFLVDGNEWLRITPADVGSHGAWVFDEPQYLLLNMAIGGDYPQSVNGAGGGLPEATRIALNGKGLRTLVDWVTVTANRDAATRIEAESADELTNIATGASPDGGQTTGSIARGDVMRFDQVDFGTGSGGVQVCAASAPPPGQTGQVELRADRPDAAPFATIPVNGTGSWDTYTTVSSPARAPAGVHTVYATFSSTQPWDFVNVDWLRFDPPPQVLRGYWPMNEAAGPAAGTAGPAGPMTLHGDVARTADVRRGAGRALHFDGSSGYAATEGPVTPTDQSFTVSAWVRLNRSGGYYTAVAQEGTQASAFYLQYSAYRNRWAFNVTGSDTAAPAFTDAVSSQPPELEKWTHLAGVYDAAAGTITLYVNGVADPAQGKATAKMWQAGGPLTIGRSLFAGQPGNFWPGDIDDVRIVSGVHTPTQIADLSVTTPA